MRAYFNSKLLNALSLNTKNTNSFTNITNVILTMIDLRILQEMILTQSFKILPI
ncbi:hypothetical protein J2772_004114 [Chryseobacterium jejuense]|nr:hypothetical protein [Chryseobacterium jejuense]